MVLSGSSDSSSSLSFSSCLVKGWTSQGQKPSRIPPRASLPLSAHGALSPAGTPGKTRPGTGRTWQWWCGNGNSHRAKSAECLLGPSSHLRAAAPGCVPPRCAHHLPLPVSWWRRVPSLQGKASRKSKSRKRVQLTLFLLTSQTSDMVDIGLAELSQARVLPPPTEAGRLVLLGHSSHGL